MPDFTGEHIREAAQWLDDQDITVVLERRCVFDANDVIDLPATFAQHNIVEERVLLESGTGNVAVKEDGYVIRLNETNDSLTDVLTRGHELGHLMLFTYHLNKGGVDALRKHVRNIGPLDEAICELVGYYCITPRRYWDCLKAGGLEEL